MHHYYQHLYDVIILSAAIYGETLFDRHTIRDKRIFIGNYFPGLFFVIYSHLVADIFLTEWNQIILERASNSFVRYLHLATQKYAKGSPPVTDGPRDEQIKVTLY
jgi:hypothetical protein